MDQEANLLSILNAQYDSYPYVKFSKTEMLSNLKNIQNEHDLKNFCFCMITPDAVTRQLVPSILQEINRLNLIITDYQVKYLSEEDIEEVYKMGFTEKILKRHKTHWWLTQKSYSLAPAIGLLLYKRDLPDQYNSACEYILRYKGKSSPSDNYNKDSIRYRLGSISKTLALFHSSDDIFAAIRESRIFFSWKRLSEGINRKQSINNTQILNSVYYCKDVNSTGFDVFYAVKIRLIATCMQKLVNIDVTCPSELTDLLSCCINTSVELSTVKEYNCCNNIFYRSAITEQQISKCLNIGILDNHISTIKGLEDFEKIQELSDIISLIHLVANNMNITSNDEQQIFKLLKTLRDNDVYITDWEKICLENFLFFYNG